MDGLIYYTEVIYASFAFITGSSSPAASSESSSCTYDTAIVSLRPPISASTASSHSADHSLNKRSSLVMRMPKLQTCFTLAAVLLLCLILRLLWISKCGELAILGGDGSGGVFQRRHRTADGDGAAVMVRRDDLVVKDPKSGKIFSYHNEMPLVFIGGFPRSGTTLMRAMLDAHPDVRYAFQLDFGSTN